MVSRDSDDVPYITIGRYGVGWWTVVLMTDDDSNTGRSRTRALLAVLPFLTLGLIELFLLLRWGIDPLWGFVILLPILFMSVLGWIAFKSGFIEQ